MCLCHKRLGFILDCLYFQLLLLLIVYTFSFFVNLCNNRTAVACDVATAPVGLTGSQSPHRHDQDHCRRRFRC